MSAYPTACRPPPDPAPRRLAKGAHEGRLPPLKFPQNSASKEAERAMSMWATQLRRKFPMQTKVSKFRMVSVTFREPFFRGLPLP
jgi:hypothetical protein